MYKLAKRALAALLMLTLLAALPFGLAGADGPAAMADSALSVVPGGADFAEDLAAAGVAVDVYRVADASLDPSYSSFVYTPLSGFTFSRALDTYESLRLMDADAWRELAQEAAATVFPETGAPLAPVTDLSALSPGLYLIAAHDAVLPAADYVKRDEQGAITTIANSSDWVYTYEPELIALPSPKAALSGALDASGTRESLVTGGTWAYSVTATLKPSREPRLGNLTISKTLTDYAGSPITVVFLVEATLSGAQVYSDVHSLRLEHAGETTLSLSRAIPVGASVTVTEVYSGPGYSPDSAAPRTAVIPIPGSAEDPALVSFTDRVDGRALTGSGIENRFTYTDAWHWAQLPAPTGGTP